MYVFLLIIDEDGTRDAVTKLDVSRPTFHMRDLHNQPSERHKFSRFGIA